jgi:hypothetical protein
VPTGSVTPVAGVVGHCQDCRSNHQVSAPPDGTRICGCRDRSRNRPRRH